MVHEQKHTRVFPKTVYGAMKDVDDFIKQGPATTTWRQAPKDQRWWVDDKPFPNLTQARQHVMDTLGIPQHDPIATEFEFVPSRGHHRQPNPIKATKGEVPMNNQTNPKLIEAAHNRDNAQREVDELRKIKTDRMTDVKRTEHTQSLRQAQARLSYRNSRYNDLLNDTPAAPKATSKVPNKEHIAATPTSLPEIDRLSAPMIMPRFDVQVGNMMSVKCNDIAAVEEVFLMVQKNTK